MCANCKNRWVQEQYFLGFARKINLKKLRHGIHYLERLYSHGYLCICRCGNELLLILRICVCLCTRILGNMCVYIYLYVCVHLRIINTYIYKTHTYNIHILLQDYQIFCIRFQRCEIVPLNLGIQKYKYTYELICIYCIYTHTHSYVCKQTHIRTNMYTHIYIHMHIPLCKHTNIYIIGTIYRNM